MCPFHRMRITEMVQFPMPPLLSPVPCTISKGVSDSKEVHVRIHNGVLHGVRDGGKATPFVIYSYNAAFTPPWVTNTI